MNNAVHYEDALMVKAAWYYYFENMTQQAIADRLSISRMRVIKLLDAARQNGVIQFRLRSDSVGMMEQSRELMQKYRLKDVFIIPEAEQESQLNESIARAGAMYVADRLGDNACINAGYGDTLSRTLNHLATMVQNPVTCISLTGGVSYYLPNGRSNVFNARLYLMPAPLLASSHEMAAAMRAEASVSEIIRMAKLSSFTLVGIGSMHETASFSACAWPGRSATCSVTSSTKTANSFPTISKNGSSPPRLSSSARWITSSGWPRARRKPKPSAPFCAAAISTCSSPMSRRQLCFSRASERP